MGQVTTCASLSLTIPSTASLRANTNGSPRSRGVEARTLSSLKCFEPSCAPTATASSKPYSDRLTLVCDGLRQDSAMTSERFEIKRQMAATPAKVFAVVSTPNGQVSIDASGMLQSADGRPPEKVGDEFVVHMDRESLNDRPLGKYDVRVIITKFERDRLIEWTISGVTQPPIRHLYGYELEPSQDGTLVTTYYDWSQISDETRARGIFPVIPETTLRATLGILARTVE
jgi:hypothetical protein